MTDRQLITPEQLEAHRSKSKRHNRRYHRVVLRIAKREHRRLVKLLVAGIDTRYDYGALRVAYELVAEAIMLAAFDYSVASNVPVCKQGDKMWIDATVASKRLDEGLAIAIKALAQGEQADD